MKGMIVFGWCCKKGYGCLGSKLSKIRIFFPFSFLPLLLNSRTPWQLLLFPVCVCHGWCVCCYCWLGGAPFFACVFFPMPHLFFLLFPLLCVVHCFVFVFVFVLSLPTKGRWTKDPTKSATGPLNNLAYGRATSFLPLFQLLLPSSHGSPTRTHAHTHTPPTTHQSGQLFLVLVFMFLLLVARAPLFDDFVSAFNVSLSESRLFCWSLRSDGDYSDTPCPYTFWIALRVFRLLILCICD